MTTIYVERLTSDDDRRPSPYAGDLYVTAPTFGSAELCAVDAACTATTMRDYARASDLEPLPEEIIVMYDHQRERSAASVAAL
jgi:hypothetical protein